MMMMMLIIIIVIINTKQNHRFSTHTWLQVKGCLMPRYVFVRGLVFMYWGLLKYPLLSSLQVPHLTSFRNLTFYMIMIDRWLNCTGQLPCILFLPFTAGFLTKCRRFHLQRASKLMTSRWTICRNAISGVKACFGLLEISHGGADVFRLPPSGVRYVVTYKVICATLYRVVCLVIGTFPEK